MFPSEIVIPYITLLYLWGFRAYTSPAHFMWTTIRFTEKPILGVDSAGIHPSSHKTANKDELVQGIQQFCMGYSGRAEV